MVRNKRFFFFQMMIFLFIFELFNSDDSIQKMTYPSSKKKEFKGKKSEYFQINFNKELTKNYLRIYVKSKGININQEVIMSTSIEKPNRANATLFAEEPFGDVFMYVSKELLDDVMYLNLTCYSDVCPIVVILSETDDFNISRDSQHSFLSNPPSLENKFYVHRSDYRNETYFDQNATMTLFVTGPPKTTKVTMKYLRPSDDGKKNYTTKIPFIKTDYGFIASFNEQDYEYHEKGLYEITVKSSEISYITVGSRSTVEGFYTKANHIFPNKRGTFGYFDKSMLSGECFRITVPYLEEKSKKDDYYLYANFIVFSETAEVYFLNQITGKEIDGKTNSIEGELGVIVTMDDVDNNVICIRPSGGKENKGTILSICSTIRE